jgi:hypothetical protein
MIFCFRRLTFDDLLILVGPERVVLALHLGVQRQQTVPRPAKGLKWLEDSDKELTNYISCYNGPTASGIYQETKRGF